MDRKRAYATPDPTSLGLLADQWKRRVNETTFAVTYVNTVTGEVSNTPPPGFNPDTDPSSKSETVKDDICSFCYVASAEVACIDCNLRFCTSCFTSVHASSPSQPSISNVRPIDLCKSDV